MQPETRPETDERPPHYTTAAALALGLLVVAAAAVWMHVRLLQAAHQEAGWPDGRTQGRLEP